MRTFIIFLALILLPGVSFAQESVAKGVMPGLTLTDPNGKKWSDRDLVGKYTLVHLGLAAARAIAPPHYL